MTESTRYRGHVSAMRSDNEFLGAEDLIERGDVWYKIEGVYRHLNRKACGKLQRQMYTIKLADADGAALGKEWWIKATNRKQLTALYGADTEAWEGQWVCLFVTEVKSPEGGLTLGIRIKFAKDPPDETTTQPKPKDEPKAAVSFDAEAKREQALKITSADPEWSTSVLEAWDAIGEAGSIDELKALRGVMSERQTLAKNQRLIEMFERWYKFRSASVRFS